MSDAHAQRAPRLRALARAFPIAGALRDYRSDDLSRDVGAGLLLGVLTVPQALAYAYLAGLPPETGLYASLLPMVIYALMGSSREMIVGPVAIIALLVADAIGEHAIPGSAEYVAMSSVLTAEVGIALLFLFAIRGSGIVNLLAAPVINGFINAAAILIVINQLDDVLGLHVSASTTPRQVLALMERLPDTDLPTLGLAALALALLLAFRIPALDRLLPRLGFSRLGPLVALTVTSVLVSVSSLDGEISVVGQVPAGLPRLHLPSGSVHLWLDLAPNAAIIALIAYLESYSIGASLAARRRRRIHPDQEALALGIANLGSAVSGGYAVAGSFARSSINFSAGARTPMSALICAVVLLATLLFLTGLFEQLPHAVLAVIIIVSVLGLIEFEPLREQWRFSHRDAFINVATFAGVLLLGIEAGLVGGVLAGLGLLVHRISRPHVAPLGRIGESEHFRNVNRHPDAHTTPGILAVRIDESIQFTNVRFVEDFILRELAQHRDARHLVIVCSGVNFIDSSGLAMVERLCEELAELGIDVHLAEVKGPIMDRLARSNLLDVLTGEVHFTTADAIRALDPEAHSGDPVGG